MMQNILICERIINALMTKRNHSPTSINNTRSARVPRPPRFGARNLAAGSPARPEGGRAALEPKRGSRPREVCRDDGGARVIYSGAQRRGRGGRGGLLDPQNPLSVPIFSLAGRPGFCNEFGRSEMPCVRTCSFHDGAWGRVIFFGLRGTGPMPTMEACPMINPIC